MKTFRFLRRSAWVPAVAFATLGLSGCNYRFGMPEPATEQGQEVLQLWQVSLYAATALGALVLGLLFYSLIRHRRRDNDLPKQTEGNIALEITYTVIPFILVGLLFAYGVVVQNTATKLTSDSSPEAADIVEVDVTGYQWNWRFHYPKDNVTVEGDNYSLPEMVLPVDKRIRFDLVAADVNHSFFVPGFLTKRDLIPGVRNEIEVTPRSTGTHIGHCAEYCGLNHSQMNFQVRIVSQAEYDQWIEQQKGKVTAQ